MSEPEDIIVVARGRDVFGNKVITYFYKGEPELKRISIYIKGDD